MITYSNARIAQQKRIQPEFGYDAGPCALFAIATATNTDYSVVAQLAYQMGKSTKGGTPVDLIAEILKKLGYSMAQVAYGKKGYTKGDPKYTKLLGSQWKTIASKLHKLAPNQTHMVITAGTICHIATCKGGNIEDWAEDRGYRVNYIYTIKKMREAADDLPKPKRKLRHKTAAKLGVNPKTGLAI